MSAGISTDCAQILLLGSLKLCREKKTMTILWYYSNSNLEQLNDTFNEEEKFKEAGKNDEKNV